MRIISGSHKGRRLRAPKSLPVRPTTDRSKEALFNILQNQYEWSEIKTLDLFSGTGNISYEFASRGVSSVTAVDQNRFCTAFISKSSKELELEIQVIQSDVFKFIKDYSLEFDLIFADPPYDIGEEKYFELIELIFKTIILNSTGSLIIEHSEKLNFEKHPNWRNSRNYGSNTFSFFER
ncbi:RsmD family RNA methyltransferase [Flavobacteriaceae bacterium]|nr:RsmD family RNA methyltransferase [Flavobacteriaceae bacterium]